MDKVSKREKEELILDLIQGFVACRNIEEAVVFVEDLITKKELEILSRRLRIAKLLMEGYGYREIQNIVHVSHSTIAKISQWLFERGEGFRRIVKELPKQREKYIDPLQYDVWSDFKKKYPSYFLPEIILEEIIKNRSRKKSAKTSEAIKNLRESLARKKIISKEIDKHS